jgi:preprotein translocase subunit SecY
VDLFEKLANIFRVPDLRKRVLYTLGLLAVYRIGAHIPTPGIDSAALARIFENLRGSALGLVDLFSGGNLSRLTIFALGITPYITSSIIFQLLTVVYEPLARLQKEGELGRKKITQYTRYLTVILGAIQAGGIAMTLQRGGFGTGERLVLNPGWGFTLTTIITLTAGTAFIMWLGEQITERGIGNGMSLLIFAGIVVGLPRAIADLWDKIDRRVWGALTVPGVILLIGFMIAVVAFIVYVERSERRVPMQFAKRMIGRRMVGGQQSYIPLRVNSGGVMPVIFASSILSIPTLFGGFAGLKDSKILGPMLDALKFGEPLYTFLYAVGIIFFAYFYVSIVFNPKEVADNMRRGGGFVPGIRPGERTSNFINDILTRITLVGALYLILISIIPEWLIAGIKLNHLPGAIGRAFEAMPAWVTNGLGLTFYFGGTSLLIVVGVAMDTANQVESQLIMRHYEGFTPRSGRIRGRRAW